MAMGSLSYFGQLGQLLFEILAFFLEEKSGQN